MIFTYIPKIQAIDKTIAFCAEIKSVYNVKIINFINIDEKNQIDDANNLFELLSNVSDMLLFIGEKSIHRNAINHLSNKQVELINKTNIKNRFKYYLDKNKTNRHLLLLPYTGSNDNVDITLSSIAKKEKIFIIAYFKSLHDEGFGLSTEPYSNIKYFKNRLLKVIERIRTKKIKSKIDDENVDLFLAFNSFHEKIIKERLGSKKVSISGYQLTYNSWIQLVKKNKLKDNKLNTIVLFTRGETPGRPPQLNIINDELLKKLIINIHKVLSDKYDNFELIIKPHPIQDVNVLKEIIKGFPNTNISYEAPSLLVVNAKFVISTYSSTVIDALIFDVPAIEYFEESNFFKNKHPNGSPFIEFGVLKANNIVEFENCVDRVFEGNYRIKPVIETIKQTPNINFMKIAGY